MKEYAVSIIIPVYNVEGYIGVCAKSLFEQDFDDIEYIFVNDCSLDSSMKILNNIVKVYPKRQDHIIFINNEYNCGSSLSRKKGLDIAHGEFIIFIDSDDWIESNMISSLYKKAKEDNADIVCCDFYINYGSKLVYKKERYNEIHDGDYFKAMISGFVLPVLFNKLQKRIIFKYINFPAFSFSEDIEIMVQVYYKISKISYIPRAFYHYNKMNINSLSNNIQQRTIDDIKKMYADIVIFLKQNNIYEDYIIYHRMRLVSVILFNLSSDYMVTLKDIDEQSNNIKLVWLNKKFLLLQKIVCSLPFLHFENLFSFIKKIYKHSTFYKLINNLKL